MSNPTRFPSGISTVEKRKTLGNYPAPNPVGSVVEYATDFNDLLSGVYTVTGTSSTFALTPEAGGAAVLTPGGATTASAAYEGGRFFQFASGLQAWFKTRFKVSSVAAPTAYAGLRIGSGTTDGLWFAVAAGGAVSLISTVNNVATTLAANIATMTDATYTDFGLYFDGIDLLVFVNDVLVARIASATIGASGTDLTNGIMAAVFQITPTATQTLTVDYVLASCEVNR